MSSTPSVAGIKEPASLVIGTKFLPVKRATLTALFPGSRSLLRIQRMVAKSISRRFPKLQPCRLLVFTLGSQITPLGFWTAARRCEAQPKAMRPRRSPKHSVIRPGDGQLPEETGFHPYPRGLVSDTRKLISSLYMGLSFVEAIPFLWLSSHSWGSKN